MGKTKETGGRSWGPSKAKYDRKDKILLKEYRWILHAEEDERFVKGWFCVRFIEPTISIPKVVANEITAIQKLKLQIKLQQKLHRKLQKEFRRKMRNIKEYLDEIAKKDMVNLMESKKKSETRKLKRREIQKQKQKDLRFDQQREAEKEEAA